jgi:type IV pilus assembly protein PilA
MKNTQKGFTLIELLVVIAIIGILSSIVIASLNSARTKGKDAAIRGQFKQLQTQAEVFYDAGGTFGTSASSTGIACAAGNAAFAGSVFGTTTSASQIALIAANDAPNSSTACSTDGTGQKWAVSITGLNSSTGGLCVDNSGSFKSGGTSFAANGVCS